MVPVSPAPAVVAAGLNKILRAFEKQQAYAPDKTISPENEGLRRNFLFRRLVFRGVLKETTTGRFYLDREALSEFNIRKRKRIFMALGLCLILLVIYYLMN